MPVHRKTNKGVPLYERVLGYISDSRFNHMVRNKVNYEIRKNKKAKKK